MQLRHAGGRNNMTPRVSKRLVIDASVARAAGGEDATLPMSKYCRDFLQATLTICHSAVMTSEIENEWKKHQSKFASRWRRSMEGRKKIFRSDNTGNNELRSKLVSIHVSKADKKVMLKDMHLIEAALITDKIVVSLDEKVRELFDANTVKLGELKNAVWINPCKTDEKPIAWLEAGARNDKHRRLGYRN